MVKCVFFCVCQVSLEFSPSSPVPGDETTMQLKAQPGSLCGVSAVDQSVLIKSPGKSLNANQVRAGISHKYLLALFLVSSAESFAPLFFLALFRLYIVNNCVRLFLICAQL